MRTAAVLLLLAGPAAAQQYLATVGPDAAVVRSGPGDKMPDTGSLPAGTTVIVHHADGDWLAIQPPRGALAWVPFGLVANIDPARPFPQNGVVDSDGRPVTLAAGRTGHGQPLSAQRTQVPDGTVLTVVGPKVKAEDGGAYYPIVPPEDDFRYLPRTAVRADPGRSPGRFTVRSPVTPDDRPAAVPASIRGGGGLWEQADDAERAGDAARAERLFLQLAGEATRATDPDLANRCFARVHALRERGRAGKPAAPPGEGWVGPGTLRPSGLNYTGRPTFALVGPRGEVKCYVLADAGLDLDRQTGNRVELFGRTTHPGDLRGTPLLTASRVQPAR
jgi:hypothetical protein